MEWVLLAFGTVGLIWIVLPLWIARVSRRVRDLEARGETPTKDADRLADLTRRVVRLEAVIREHAVPVTTGEATARPTAAVALPTTKPAVASTPVVATPSVVASPPVVTWPPVVASPPVAQTPPVAATPSVAPPTPVAAPPQAPQAPPKPARPGTAPSVRTAAQAPAQASEPSPAGATGPFKPAGSSRDWEVTVGTSWLNKVGVLVFVIGLALLVGYSMAHIGPAGRVAIGFALSFGLLAGGVTLERRPVYRTYAYGLIAGGWAGTYFTTYAMHGVDAAHVIDSDVLGAALLVIVAAGMIAHSIRYRSQTVTALAYIVAYATLALTPLTGFSLVASVPLAVSLVVVAQQFGWSGVSILGLASTYGLFAFRHQAGSGAEADATTLAPFLALAMYWLTFEAADIVGLRRSRQTSAPLFIVNAIGLMGAGLLQLRPEYPAALAWFLGAAGTAYVASAITRAWLVGRESLAPAEGFVTFGTVQAAIAVAAAALGGAIHLHFDGPQRLLALLLETELLVAAGMTLGDRHIRQIGSFVAIFVSLRAAGWSAGDPRDLTLWSAPVHAWVASVGAVAATWYANREWLRARAVAVGPVEHGYTWVATWLVVAIGFAEIGTRYRGLAGLVFALALVEAGLRRGAEYRYQAYAVGTIAAFLLVDRFALQPSVPDTMTIWRVLPAAIVLTYLAAARLASKAVAVALRECTIAAGVAGTVGTLLLVILEWRVVPPPWVSTAWAATATSLMILGARRRVEGIRGQAYALLLLAAADTMQTLLEHTPTTTIELLAIVSVVGLLYAASAIARAPLRARAATVPSTASTENAVAILVRLAATSLLVVLQWKALSPAVLGPALAATAAALLAAGARRRAIDLRWHGYPLLFGAVAQTIRPLLEGAPTGRWEMLAAAVVIAIAYAVRFGGRHLVRRTPAVTETAAQLERAVLMLAGIAGSTALTSLAWRVIDPLRVGATIATIGAVLLAIGLRRRATDLRWQGYTLLAGGAGLTLQPILPLGAAAPLAIAGLGIAIALLYVSSLAARRVADSADEGSDLERTCRLALSVAATLLLTTLIYLEVRPTLVTLSWAIAGAALLAIGLPARERVLRLSGLALLVACIVKSLASDVWDFEPLARIVSFIALGVTLLGVSLAYTRFREQIRRYL